MSFLFPLIEDELVELLPSLVKGEEFFNRLGCYHPRYFFIVDDNICNEQNLETRVSL